MLRALLLLLLVAVAVVEVAAEERFRCSGRPPVSHHDPSTPKD